MFDRLAPLHAMMLEKGPETLREIAFDQSFGVDLKDLIPQNLTVIIPPVNGSAKEPTVLNAQTLYEELTASQKQLIQMQQHRIDQLEQENRQLREQVIQTRGKPTNYHFSDKYY